MRDSKSRQLDRIEDGIGLILNLMNQILARETAMANVLDDLEAKVEALTTVEKSAETLLKTLNDELKAALASNDTARIQAVVDKIDADSAALAAAVAANTPAAGSAAPAAGTKGHGGHGHGHGGKGS